MLDFREYFDKLMPVMGQIQFGNQTFMNAESPGKIEGTTVVVRMKKKIVLHNIRYLPHLVYNLISVLQARRIGYRMTIDDGLSKNSVEEMKFLHERSMRIELVVLEACEGLFEVKIKTSTRCVNMTTDVNYKPPHETLGRSAIKTLRQSMLHFRRFVKWRFGLTRNNADLVFRENHHVRHGRATLMNK